MYLQEPEHKGTFKREDDITYTYPDPTHIILIFILFYFISFSSPFQREKIIISFKLTFFSSSLPPSCIPKTCSAYTSDPTDVLVPEPYHKHPLHASATLCSHAENNSEAGRLIHTHRTSSPPFHQPFPFLSSPSGSS